MATALRQSKRFSAASPVTRYWLVNCAGFSVAGGAHGTVERVLADDDPHAPSLLEVRTKHQRLLRVPAERVLEVVPAERVVVVARGRTVAERTRPARRRLEAGTRTGARLTGRLAIELGLTLLWLLATFAALLREVWRAGYPLAKAGAIRGGRETARLVRSVPWQRYGRSARSATTRLSQARSQRSSPRRTTSSETSSAPSSTERVRTTSST